MNPSNNCINLIKESEGCVLHPYLDPIGIPTIGIGTTMYPNGKKVSMNDPNITVDQANEFLMHDLIPIANCINDNVKVTLNQNQFDALCDFVYNVGITNFIESTLLQYLNKAQYLQASNQLLRWIYGGGKQIQGLINRRQKEQKLFNS